MAKEKKDKKTPFTLEKGKDGVAILTFDLPDESVNKLSSWIMTDLQDKMKLIQEDSSLKGIVFISGKPDNFIVGADIDELSSFSSAKEAEELIDKAHNMLNDLEASKMPVVAAIHGPALGGGLEVALACHYRICSRHKKTSLGLPEVQLGLLPAAGGTQRLPRLIGLQAALDMILTGKNIRPKQALKMGLVDEVVFELDLLTAARTAVLKLAAGKLKPQRPAQKSAYQLATDFNTFFKPKKLIDFALESNPLGRHVVFDQASKMVLKKTAGLYPAPAKILETIKIGLENGMKEGLAAEKKAFAELVMSDVSYQLRNIFFATTSLKKETWNITDNVKPKKLNLIGILGGGFMGAGIATVLASKGYYSRIRDIDPVQIGKAYRYAHDFLYKGVKRKYMQKSEYERKIGSITASTDYTGFKKADLVIEAVFEDIDLKHKVIKETEAVVSKNCIFASNTSSIPITDLAKASKRPENFIGMHFFSPVEKMPLLEIIITKKTSPETTATCVELGRAMGKQVIVVNDGTGFYTSRILGPYAREAAFLLMDGVRMEVIDKAAKQLGFPVGPITLLDEVGIDVVYKVGPVMHKAFGERFAPVPAMERLINDKRYGRKNKRGFYNYQAKKKVPDESVYKLFPEIKLREYPKQKIQDRLLYSFMNEAAMCFEDKILFSVRDGDIGAIFGLGFPPLTGGPFRHMDTLKVENVVKKLEGLEKEFGLRFKPAQILIEMSQKGDTFYPQK
ncbi:fatty acid oxidation complex subunit alpha FadJ [candidate division CSSED10-310 bacterium]|uniref:enoyl-CoA hydratase n=1 Tax=candidate division CSSED10-310 bacterium TaxID=2855610 RepID=A0ABV6YY45_UNCC1